MKLLEVNKKDRLFQAEGWALYATNDDDVQIMQWEREDAGALAWHLHQMMRVHTLATNAIQRFGVHGVVVRRLEMIDITLVVKSTVNNSDITMVGSQGTTLNPKAAKQVPGAKPTRLSNMEDVSLHLARTLRAHLAPLGLTDLELRLHFGVDPGGACLLQVPNPLECAFGSADYAAICNQLCPDDE